jgi:putative hydrolase of the HAD superfamily
MPGITTLFFDVGGVLLTNGWDWASRHKAVEHFQLDGEEFEDRHELLNPAFERGEIRLAEYLDRTVFYRQRNFTRQEFKDFMFAQSIALPDSLALMAHLSQSKRYLLGTLNNESLDLNLHRIETFGLRRYFSVFFSSCFLGVKKPEAAIYRLALQMTQCAPDEFVFIDDRAVNLECARQLGINTIQFRSATQLASDLRNLGVVV